MLGKYGADYRARCREVPAPWRSRRVGRVPVSATVSAVRRKRFRLLAGAVLVLLLLGIVKLSGRASTAFSFYWLVATGTALALFLAGWRRSSQPARNSASAVPVATSQ